MNVLVINGNPQPSSFDTWIEQFCAELRARSDPSSQAHSGTPTRTQSPIHAREFRLRDQQVRPCTGCWSCWYKTPGRCAIDDDASALYPHLFNADLVIWASPLILGAVSGLTKTMQDRFIPQVHPYIELVNGESHHRKRYAHNPRSGLILQRGELDGDEDVTLACRLAQRHAANARAGDDFFFCETSTPAEEAARAMLSA